MSVYVSICLSVYPPMYLLSVYMSVSLSVCLSICMSVYIFVHPSVYHPFIYPSIYMSDCILVTVSIYGICLPLSLSLSLSLSGGSWCIGTTEVQEQESSNKRQCEACAVCCMYPGFSVDSWILVSDCPSAAVTLYGGLGYGSVEHSRSGRCHVSPRKAPACFLMARWPHVWERLPLGTSEIWFEDFHGYLSKNSKIN